MIKHRLVFHIAGYDPIHRDEQLNRFVKQIGIFAATWNVVTTLPEGIRPGTLFPRDACSVTTKAADWSVATDYELLVWDDLIRADMQRPIPVRMAKAARTYADLFWTGTILRYFSANGRYAMFSLFPLFQLVLLASVAWGLALVGANSLEIGFVGRVVIWLALFALLLRWPGYRWRLHQALDDWILADDYIHGRRQDLESRLERFAERLVTAARAGEADEIVVVGHSLGAMLAVDVVARALRLDPALTRHGSRVCILTVGATIPKCALHPRAVRVRRTIQDVLQAKDVFWAEYHSRDDAISFYKFDPASLKRVAEDQIEGKPVIRRVQIHDMMRPETFARNRFRFLRLHYQPVMANDRRAAYDYFMMMCGPLPLSRWTRSPKGLLDFPELVGSRRRVKAET